MLTRLAGPFRRAAQTYVIRAKELVLFHHDRDHSDECIDSVVKTASEYYSKVRAASEDMEIQL